MPSPAGGPWPTTSPRNRWCAPSDGWATSTTRSASPRGCTGRSPIVPSMPCGPSDACAISTPPGNSRWSGWTTPANGATCSRPSAALDVDRRTAVVMRYWLDLAPGEIADALGVPVGTVHSRLARALPTCGRLARRCDDRSRATHRRGGPLNGPSRPPVSSVARGRPWDGTRPTRLPGPRGGAAARRRSPAACRRRLGRRRGRRHGGDHHHLGWGSHRQCRIARLRRRRGGRDAGFRQRGPTPRGR